MTKEEVKVLDIDEIYKNPILKPLNDYEKTTKSLKEDEVKESAFLNVKSEKIEKLLKTGIFDDSSIVPTYERVIDYYKSIMNIFKKYIKTSDEVTSEIKTIVSKHYISKKEQAKEINELKKGHTKELNELKKEHVNEIKKLKKQN